MSDVFPRFSWHCPPPAWFIDPKSHSLRIETAAPTDFWQRTHYGFAADNGHFFHMSVEGDFLVTACIDFQPAHQYDQAGLMVRLSPSCWLKTSVECEPGSDARLGAVVTNSAWSDWSTQPFQAGPGRIWLSIRRESSDYTVESSTDGDAWTQIRLAHLHDDAGLAVSAGLYACSPKEAGFSATFSSVTIKPLRSSL